MLVLLFPFKMKKKIKERNNNFPAAAGFKLYRRRSLSPTASGDGYHLWVKAPSHDWNRGIVSRSEEEDRTCGYALPLHYLSRKNHQRKGVSLYLYLLLAYMLCVVVVAVVLFYYWSKSEKSKLSSLGWTCLRLFRHLTCWEQKKNGDNRRQRHFDISSVKRPQHFGVVAGCQIEMPRVLKSTKEMEEHHHVEWDTLLSIFSYFSKSSSSS